MTRTLVGLRFRAGLFFLGVFAICVAADAQMTSVTAPSGSLTMNGVTIASGTASFSVVDAVRGGAVAVRAGDKIFAPQAITCTIAGGAISSCSVPDLSVALSLRANVTLAYNITVFDVASHGSYALQNVGGVQGSTWALNTYAPAQNAPVVATALSTGSTVPSSCRGAAKFYTQTNPPADYDCVGNVFVLQTSSNGSGVSIAWRSAYGSGTAYAVNDAVSYGGSSYISLQASNTGHQPDTSSSWWGLLAAKGSDGLSGQGFTLRGVWAASTAYAAYDVVVYGGQSYVAPTAFTSSATFNSTNWILMAMKGSDGDISSATLTSELNRILPQSRNLYDPAQATASACVNPATGAVVTGLTGYTASGMFRVNGSGAITANRDLFGNSAQYGLAYYDGSGNYVSGVTGVTVANTTLTVPSTARYARVCMTNANTTALKIANGVSAAGYATYDPTDKYGARGEYANRLAEYSATNTGINLLDRTSWTSGNLNASCAIAANSGFQTSNYMPVSQGKTYVTNFSQSSSTGLCWFDFNKTMLPGGYQAQFASGTAYTAPDGAAYPRVTANTGSGGPKQPIVVSGTATPTTRLPSFGYTDDEGALLRAFSQSRGTQPVTANYFVVKQASASCLAITDGVTANTVAGCATSGYIPAQPGASLYVNFSFTAATQYGWMWFDADKNYIGSTVNGYSANVAVSVPMGAHFGRVHVNSAVLPYVAITDVPLSASSILFGWEDVSFNKPWAGRNMVTLGDSIMACSASGGVTSAFPYGCMQSGLVYRLGANMLIAGGISGQTMAQLLNNNPNTSAAYVQADFANVDLVISNAGTNSFGVYDGTNYTTGRAIGVLGDGCAASTFYGDMYCVFVSKLQTWNPTMTIAMWTILPRFDNGNTTGDPVNTSGLYLHDYNNAIVAFAKQYGFPLLDMGAVSQLNAINYTTYLESGSGGVNDHGLHPNATYVQNVYVPVISKWLNRIR